MGQAKNRGSFEERKQKAIEAGKLKKGQKFLLKCNFCMEEKIVTLKRSGRTSMEGITCKTCKSEVQAFAL